MTWGLINLVLIILLCRGETIGPLLFSIKENDFSSRRIKVSGIQPLIQRPIKIGEKDLTLLWLDLVKRREVFEEFPLCCKGGSIDWKEGAKTETKNVGIFRVSYNPARAKRPRSSVSQSQSKQECLFCKLGFPAEHPWNELLRYRGFKILVNPFPIVKEGHFTIIPISEEHIPQELTPKYIEFALELVRDSQNLFLAFNSWINAEENAWRARATQPHFHFHGFYRGEEQFPIEKVSTEKVKEENGVEIYNIKFPAHGIMLEGENPRALGEVLWNYIRELQSLGFNYNVIFFKDKVYLFGRKKEGESPLQKVGALEMLGWFIISDEGIFIHINSDKLKKILEEVTVSPE
jgi:diadenosine tetraphosphate (Ap4A) HIT family hydrolase